MNTVGMTPNSALDISGFLSVAAHEVANPLNAISMSAELAKMLLQRDQPAQAIEVLERLLAECGRCARVVRGIQRFGSGLKPRKREEVPARALLDAAITRYLQERPGPTPAIHLDCVDDPVLIDRVAIEQSIARLLHNAAEADATAVDIQAMRDADSLSITVRDNGHGIPDDVRPHVAEAFFTTRRAAGHNGLGLTLADACVRAHGGELSFDENPGGGSRVLVRLPV